MNDKTELRDAKTLQALLDMISMVDDLVEQAVQERRSLERTLDLVLPAVIERLGAQSCIVRTIGEDLSLGEFRSPEGSDSAPVEGFFKANEADHDHTIAEVVGDVIVVGQGLDVAGEWFGSAALIFAHTPENEARLGFLPDALDAACEQLDNFFIGIRDAREKHQVMMALAKALSNRVLADGLEDAVGILADAIPLGKLMLTLLAEESEAAPIHVQVYDGANTRVDTMRGKTDPDVALPPDLQRVARAYLRKDDRTLVEALGFGDAAEEVLVSGVKNANLVGKVLATPREGEFDTHDRELLSGFADFIRQRVVDFNKEFKTLARNFCPEMVNRMLRTHDYSQRYLTPREDQVAMLYVDIAGFTRLCEQVLTSPKQIGELVHVWGERTVQIVWDFGGVFDKMVGDCVIGLFGPPFYEADAGKRVENAIRAALAIRTMTNELAQDPRFEVLRQEGLGVSSGVNFASLFVGRFGPDENFTGFSSGMNNTARLQAKAQRNEILVMQGAIDCLADGVDLSFGEPQQAKVKNVAKPIEFRAVTTEK